jgi:hypothetical protein
MSPNKHIAERAKIFRLQEPDQATNMSGPLILTKAGLNKDNILKVIAGDDHVINIEEEKSATTRRSVDKQHRIMSAGGETGSIHHRGETLKPGARDLF